MGNFSVSIRGTRSGTSHSPPLTSGPASRSSSLAFRMAGPSISVSAGAANPLRIGGWQVAVLLRGLVAVRHGISGVGRSFRVAGCCGLWGRVDEVFDEAD